MNKPKYGNKKTTLDGVKFDSKKEANRWCELRLLERSGTISNLRRQVHFQLIPTQRAESTEIYKGGPQKGLPKPGKVLERASEYIADFVYTTDDGELIVEDAKGFKTKEYILKRKLMLLVHGIRIREV